MKHKKNVAKFLLIFLSVCLMILLAFAYSLFFTEKAPAPHKSGNEVTVNEEQAKESSTVSLSTLIDTVLSIKDDLAVVLYHLEVNDLESALTEIDFVSEKLDTVQDFVNNSVSVIGKNTPLIGKTLTNIQNLLDLADMGIERLLKPGIIQLQAYPFSGLRSGDGISTKWLGAYIDFAESIMPDVELVIQKANTVDLSLIDIDGRITEYLTTANEFLAIYHENPEILLRLKDVLGVEEDRVYLVAAQNSAEIRASGGFPGAMGVIRITDGVLIMEDFKSVYDVLSMTTPAEGKVTALENKLFHSGLKAPRDADYCPVFERVAYIWALGYKGKQKESIDGVISITPCVLQRLLSAANADITLFDGTNLNGENATKVLQHDLYFKYFGNEPDWKANDTCDKLFAEAGRQTMQLLIDNFQIAYLDDYLLIAKESFADRTLMIWMQNESEQSLIQKFGWNGGLNTDPQNPQAGVYYSCTIPTKMGWFLIMNTEIGERVQNDDGSYTYPVVVTFANNITDEELNIADRYILGGYRGSIYGSAYFFAPADGTVDNFVSSNSRTIKEDRYHDLELGYMLNFHIRPGETVSVTYNVTTAPGVETPLTFSKTPTVQNYH